MCFRKAIKGVKTHACTSNFTQYSKKKKKLFFLHMKAITANSKSTVYLKFSYANSVTNGNKYPLFQALNYFFIKQQRSFQFRWSDLFVSNLSCTLSPA